MPQTSFEWVLFVVSLLFLASICIWAIIGIIGSVKHTKYLKKLKLQASAKPTLSTLEQIKESLKDLNTYSSNDIYWRFGNTMSTSDGIKNYISDKITEKNKKVLRELINYIKYEDILELVNNRLCYDIEQDKSDIIEFFLYEKSVYRGTKEKAIEYARENLHQSNYTAKGNGVYFVEPKEYHKAKAKPQEEKGETK